MNNTSVDITGLAAVTIAPGALTSERTISGAGGALITDPRVAIVPASAGAVSSGIPRTVRSIPALTQSLQFGSGQMPLPGALRAEPGDLFAVLLAAPVQPVSLPQFDGVLAVDPAQSVLIASGTTDSSGQAAWLIPPVPIVVIWTSIGQRLVTQGVAGTARLRLTNPLTTFARV